MKVDLPKRVPHIGASWRAILVGLLLIPPNTYWIMDSAGQGYPTTVSLYFNVIFCVFVIAVLNYLLTQISSRFAVKQGELLTIYIMLAIASSVAGHDMLRVLIPMIPHAFWYASTENDWADLFHRFVPSWLAVSDRRFLTDYYRGESDFYQWEVIQGWSKPILAWGSFLCLMLFLMVCINSLVRKQWTENEKLSYPIIQLPLELTIGGGTSGILRNRIMWVGFIVAAAIDILNGLNFLFPSVPSLGGKLYDLLPFFSRPPLNAIGWTPIAIFPFAV